MTADRHETDRARVGIRTLTKFRRILMILLDEWRKGLIGGILRRLEVRSLRAHRRSDVYDRGMLFTAVSRPRREQVNSQFIDERCVTRKLWTRSRSQDLRPQNTDCIGLQYYPRLHSAFEGRTRRRGIENSGNSIVKITFGRAAAGIPQRARIRGRTSTTLGILRIICTQSVGRAAGTRKRKRE